MSAYPTKKINYLLFFREWSQLKFGGVHLFQMVMESSSFFPCSFRVVYIFFF